MSETTAAVATWVQAAATFIQGGAAVVLVVVTLKYVRLTAKLAAASEAQVELMRADRDIARADKATQFRALAQMLLARVRQLPGVGSDARQTADRLFRSAALPSDDDLNQLRTLGVSIGPAIAERAAAAADNFARLLRTARAIQATRPEMGYDYRLINWNEWTFYWTETEATLAKLAAA